jgi:TolA-binding protein
MATNPFPPPASDEPVYEIDPFELFWEKHKAQIIGGAVALVAAIVVVFSWYFITASRESAAESAFAAAKAPADYRAVIDKYPSLPVAGDAAMLLGKSLRDEKKYDEANGVLNQFVKAQPKHPFAPLARVAVAQNLALAGKIDEATKALEAVAQSDPASFAAPVALLIAAETEAAQGQREAAVRIYRELQRTFPTSVAARVAAPTAEALTVLVSPTAPATKK